MGDHDAVKYDNRYQNYARRNVFAWTEECARLLESGASTAVLCREYVVYDGGKNHTTCIGKTEQFLNRRNLHRKSN